MNKRNIKKSIISSVIIIFILFIGIWFGRHLYYYYHPPITIVSMWGQDEDFYMSTPSFGIEYKSVFGTATTADGEIVEINKQLVFDFVLTEDIQM